jgi:DNA invertase Pin-like site-specific DNA recombinase
MTLLTDNADEIRKLVRALRTQGMTPAQIATRMNVTLRTVYRWQKGDTGPRDVTTLTQLRNLQGAHL